MEKLDYPDFEVVVVDNGSTDDSLEVLRSAYPRLNYLENGTNLGYAGGNNRGLKWGMERGADLLFLLNNDTIVHKNLLKELAHAASMHPEVAVFGPKIFMEDDPATIWYAGGSVDPQTGRCYHIGHGAPSGYDEMASTDYVCGCALAVRPEAIELVGMMDERFFLIWEEIDWCYRFREKGWGCLFVPKAMVWHKISSSFVQGNRGPMWQYYYHRNRLLFHEKRGVRWHPSYSRDFLDLMKGSLSHNEQYRAALLGVRDFYLRKFGKSSRIWS